MVQAACRIDPRACARDCWCSDREPTPVRLQAGDTRTTTAAAIEPPMRSDVRPSRKLPEQKLVALAQQKPLPKLFPSALQANSR